MSFTLALTSLSNFIIFQIAQSCSVLHTYNAQTFWKCSLVTTHAKSIHLIWREEVAEPRAAKMLRGRPHSCYRVVKNIVVLFFIEHFQFSPPPSICRQWPVVDCYIFFSIFIYVYLSIYPVYISFLLSIYRYIFVSISKIYLYLLLLSLFFTLLSTRKKFHHQNPFWKFSFLRFGRYPADSSQYTPTLPATYIHNLYFMVSNIVLLGYPLFASHFHIYPPPPPLYVPFPPPLPLYLPTFLHHSLL